MFALQARCGNVRFRGLLRRSSSCSDQSWQLDEIVSGHRPDELEVELFDATQHGPRRPADGLAPPERLLDALALLFDTADFVAHMRTFNVTPHIAQNTSGRRSAIDEPH